MKKCKQCLAHYTGEHQCDGLMKHLVNSKIKERKHNCNQNIESNMCEEHCRICNKPMKKENEKRIEELQKRIGRSEEKIRILDLTQTLSENNDKNSLGLKKDIGYKQALIDLIRII